MKRSREPEDLDSDHQSGDAGSPDTVSTTEPFAKVIQLDVTEVTVTSVSAMKCSLPPHKDSVSFQSYEEWETHYNQAHTNRCNECRKNFPSAHLLELHIEECHDSFIAVKRDRGEHTFSCFVEGCERKCRTPQKRRMHLIDKHMYPKNFFFAVTKEGIDGRRSLLVDGSHHRRRSSTGASTTKDNRRRASILESGGPSSPKSSGTVKPTRKATGDEDSSEDSERDEPDTEMAELTGAMSALQFVPSSVRFGRGGKRGGLAKR